MMRGQSNKEKTERACLSLPSSPRQEGGIEDAVRANQRGSALIITLLLITILTGLVVDFVYDVYIDTAALSNWGNAQRASFIAKSGQTVITEFIDLVNNETYTDRRELEFPLTQDFGPNVYVSVKMEDENAKFNINSIIYENGLTHQEALSTLKKLCEYLNINPGIALSIADWIDPDSEPRLSESEDRAKNDFLWAIDELIFIEGMDEDTFNKISPHITVYGNKLININTAELPVLVSLRDDMTEDLARRIIDYRETTPFEDSSHIVRVSGLESIGQQMLGGITVKAASFRVTTIATVNDITRVVESVMDSSAHIHFWREG